MGTTSAVQTFVSVSQFTISALTFTCVFTFDYLQGFDTIVDFYTGIVIWNIKTIIIPIGIEICLCFWKKMRIMVAMQQ